MRQIGTFEAKNRLSALIDLVQAGEEIEITRNGKPVSRLVAPPDPELGRARAQEAVSALRALRGEVKPDPEGLTILDYIEMGRRS